MIRRAHFALACVLACGTATSPTPSGAVAQLGGATIAVAGAIGIDRALVADVARANAETPQQAIDALVFDAVLAQGASARHLDRTAVVRQAERAVLARLVADRIDEAARDRGPPTDEELAKLTARHWRDVDCPEQARVVHVVVSTNDPEKMKRLRDVAEAVRKAVLDAKDAQDFVARAKAVDAEGLTVKRRAPADVRRRRARRRGRGGLRPRLRRGGVRARAG